MFALEPEEVINKSYDACSGCYTLSNERIQNYSFTFPHYKGTSKIFFKNYKDSMNSIEILLAPFDMYCWIMLGFSIIIGTLLLYFSQPNTSFTESFLTVIALLLALSIRLKSKKFFLRVQYLSWIMVGITIFVAHHGVFFNLLNSSLLSVLLCINGEGKDNLGYIDVLHVKAASHYKSLAASHGHVPVDAHNQFQASLIVTVSK